MKRILLAVGIVALLFGLLWAKESGHIWASGQARDAAPQPTPAGSPPTEGRPPETVTDAKAAREVSDRLVSLALRDPYVTRAAAVVAGDFAVVAIDVPPNLDASQVNTTKYAVAETLRRDPYGAKAVVVADPDLYGRVEELSRAIQEGRPIQAVLDELADIVARISPQPSQPQLPERSGPQTPEPPASSGQ
ncbi:YhcN/YlaJ family sporulation lipoprotein [Brockia lithotrophica]|uniref:YhcN/YlaJ family sporulation lipoprotein n=1 Tax=Brockia lithotrophica TaxID=933949 RepID=A0A660KUW9_9BACL|nr:YhcN/YlaJ family sporulation lipoprotein [Brockia lithotrophica]RKQ83648.1 YhcN/YlaJ family sporulation lipoprotein [Brockia lithotrophica]